MANPISDFVAPPSKAAPKKAAAVANPTSIGMAIPMSAESKAAINAVQYAVHTSIMANDTSEDIDSPGCTLANLAYQQLLDKVAVPAEILASTPTSMPTFPPAPIITISDNIRSRARVAEVAPVLVKIDDNIVGLTPDDIQKIDFIDVEALDHEDLIQFNNHTLTLGIIYLITCVVTGMKYIGQTRYNLEHRWKHHVYCTRYTNRLTRFVRAILEHGAENFTREVLCTVPYDQLNAAESAAIIEHNCLHPNGYNSTSGGSAGSTMSQDTLDKRSTALRGLTRDNAAKRLYIQDMGLPKYMSSVYRGDVHIGYTINKHPNMGNSSCTFTSGTDIDYNLAQARNCLESLETGNYCRRYPRLLPVGMEDSGSSFKVNVANQPIKHFTDTRMPLHDRFNAAMRYLHNMQLREVAAGRMLSENMTPYTNYLEFCIYEAYEKFCTGVTNHDNEILRLSALPGDHKKEIKRYKTDIKSLRQGQRELEERNAYLPLQICCTPTGYAVMCLDQVYYFHSGTNDVKLQAAYKCLSENTNIPVDDLKRMARCVTTDAFYITDYKRPNPSEKRFIFTFSNGLVYVMNCNGYKYVEALPVCRDNKMWNYKNRQRAILLRELISNHYQVNSHE